MPKQDLLARARVEAERATPPVRAAALMRIARIQTAFDRGQARITFEMGLEETRGLRGRERKTLLSGARLLAAAVEPKLLREIPSETVGPEWLERGMLVNVMLEHKLVDAAFEYVMDGENTGFPFGYAVNLIHRIEDESRRVAVVRRAVEAWRSGDDGGDVFGFNSSLRIAVDDCFRLTKGVKSCRRLFATRWSGPMRERLPGIRTESRSRLAGRIRSSRFCMCYGTLITRWRSR